MSSNASPSQRVSGTIAWRLHRLQMMSAEEVLWRIRQRAVFEMWRRRHRPPPPSPRFLPRDAYGAPASFPPEENERVVDEGMRLLEGTYTALGFEFDVDQVIWNLDPQSGVTAPLTFGPLIDLRDPQLVGNVRNTWELNRHQHLVQAAAAYALGRDERLARFVRRQLESWLHQNAFPMGVNWASPLELGLRLISWVWVSRCLAGSPEHETLFGLQGCLWPAIYRHQWLIAELHSRGSSANNHLIGEMSGLYVSAATWPVFDQSKTWAQLARHSLHQEIRRQYYGSGLNREQAFGYHVFATELLMLAALEGERTGSPFSVAYLDGLRRAVSSGLALTSRDGRQPNYGDSDDGVALSLDAERPGVSWLPMVASAWLGGLAPDRNTPAATRAAARLLLSGIRPPEPHAPAIASPPRTRAFHDAGLFVMASGGEGDEVICLADAGDLGYLSIAAHGHADALSFTLSVGDEQLVVDPGTFTYHFDPEARAYFRGTRAHNAVVIDGEDQSRSAGPFLWTRKARAKVHNWQRTDRGAVLAASHDGYERLASPVTHRRTLVLDGGQLTIDDELEGSCVHDVEWRLHLAPGCQARLGAQVCEIVGRRHRVSLQLDQTLQWRALMGDAAGGWYSGFFNQRQQTTTLVGSARLALPVRLRHVLGVCP
jgi:hypothetical protein